MDPDPPTKESEARADRNMARPGASGEDASSASPASTEGARPGQSGALGLLTPGGEPRHEQAIRDEHNRAGVRLVECWHSSGSNELWDGLNQPDRGEDGDGHWVSVQRCSLFRAGQAPDLILGAPVSWLLESNRGLSHGRQATYSTDDYGSPAVSKHGLSAEDQTQTDLLAAGGWHVPLREATGFNNGRPPTTIGDETAIRWAFLRLLGAAITTGSDKPELLAFQYLYSNTDVNMRALARLSGASKSTLYDRRKWLRQAIWTKPSKREGSSLPACFKCLRPAGKPRRSANAVVPRTVHICDACFVSPAERSARKKALEKSREPSPEKRYSRPPEEGSPVHHIASQNTEILARLERMQAQMTETLQRCAETAERLRERFPTDGEVSAAVNAFLEDAAT